MDFIREKSTSKRLMKYLYHYGCIMRKDASILNYCYASRKHTDEAVSRLIDLKYCYIRTIEKSGDYLFATEAGLKKLSQDEETYPYIKPVTRTSQAERNKSRILASGAGVMIFPESKPSLKNMSFNSSYSDNYSDWYKLGLYTISAGYNLGLKSSVRYKSGGYYYSKQEILSFLNHRNDEILRRSTLTGIVLRGNTRFFFYNGSDSDCKFRKGNERTAVNLILGALGLNFVPICIIICNKFVNNSIKSIINLHKPIPYAHLKQYKAAIGLFQAVYCLPYTQESVRTLQNILNCPVCEGDEYINSLTDWLNGDICTSYLADFRMYIDNLYMQTVSSCPKTAVFLPCFDLVSVYNLIQTNSKYAIFAPSEHKDLYYALMGDQITVFLPIN